MDLDFLQKNLWKDFFSLITEKFKFDLIFKIFYFINSELINQQLGLVIINNSLLIEILSNQSKNQSKLSSFTWQIE